MLVSAAEVNVTRLIAECFVCLRTKWYFREMELAEATPSVAELRNEAERFLQLARNEAVPQLKRGYAGCAFAISQLAECIEVREREDRP